MKRLKHVCISLNFSKEFSLFFPELTYFEYVYLELVDLLGVSQFFMCFGMCLFMCSARWSDLAKLRSHTLHLKGLAPVCFL